MVTTLLVFAQCVEVKGVETRKKDIGRENENLVGFEFKNLNNYEITIEAELRRPACSPGGEEYVVMTTKTFVLKLGETYVWECYGTFYCASYWSNATYVKFKAFKCP
jgi:hypothetical protein